MFAEHLWRSNLPLEVVMLQPAVTTAGIAPTLLASSPAHADIGPTGPCVLAQFAVAADPSNPYARGMYSVCAQFSAAVSHAVSTTAEARGAHQQRVSDGYSALGGALADATKDAMTKNAEHRQRVSDGYSALGGVIVDAVKRAWPW